LEKQAEEGNLKLAKRNNKIMKILITGASGFLGQHFLLALMQEASDKDIFAIYNASEDFEDAVRSHKEANASASSNRPHLTKLDLTNQNDVDKFFKSQEECFEICFHLAALSSPRACHADPESAKLINVPSIFMEKLKDTPVIALSTDQVYDGKSSNLYEETNEAGPLNVYAQTKLDLENLLLSSNERSRPTICLRSSIILGPHAPFGGAHSTFLHFCQSREGEETTFFTDEIRSVVNVNDVIQTLLFFFYQMQKGTIDELDSTVYNMGGPDASSRMEMAVAVAKQLSFQNHEKYFIPAKKAEQNLSGDSVLSPLDISMSSLKLEQLVGLKFQGLDSTVNQTFS
jgi:dTDP-4-dehydrorhamnose reductase